MPFGRRESLNPEPYGLRAPRWRRRRAFETHCRVGSGGHSGLDSVLVVPPPRRDRMESFWLAETLKYAWLLFSEDTQLLPLDQWVFNTEVRPKGMQVLHK